MTFTRVQTVIASRRIRRAATEPTRALSVASQIQRQAPVRDRSGRSRLRSAPGQPSSRRSRAPPRGPRPGRRLWAAPLEERARAELEATGARPRSTVLSGVDALTPSELRTARMAADGLTNREIAQQLFVTKKTVEIHLRHTYQKLDIARRTELSAALGSES